ncbi:MAG: hypothetical protein ISS29_05635 [Candidatus Marinimicrobia bacterium]|nr:hypothetical protein [Candidatus Neomarinimicrobiota bacterium]
MKKQNSRKQNRVWILLNYFSLIALIVFFYTGKYFQWPISLVVFEIGSVVVFLISFLKAFIKTKYWKMVHTSYKNLDEREMQVVLNALRYAYSIFTIVCLIIIYAFAIVEYHPIDVLLAAGLLYLAHTLPAAIAAWNEKNISIDDD